MIYGYPKALRLLSRYDYRRMFKLHKKFHGQLIVIEVRFNRRATTRLGVTVTKKFGHACQRNRFKRLVREAFRLSYATLPKGLDLNVRPQAAASCTNMDAIRQELLNFLCQPL